MKLSRKVISLCIGSVVLFALIAMSIVYGRSRSIVIGEEQNKALIISQILNSMTSGSAASISNVTQFLSSKDANVKDYDVYSYYGHPVNVDSTNSKHLGSKPGTKEDTVAKKNQMSIQVSGDVMSVIMPLHDSTGSVEYILDANFLMTSAMSTIRQLLIEIVLTAIGTLLVIGVLVTYLSRRLVTRPLYRVIHAAEKVSSGNLGVELGEDTNRVDEIGMLARTFSSMVSDLRLLVGKVSDTAEHVAQSANELVRDAENTSQATENISLTIQEIATGSEKQVQTVLESELAMNEITSTLQAITDYAVNASQSAESASTLATDGQVVLENVSLSMNSIHSTVNNLARKVSTLGSQSREIAQIVSVISDIASQTNLLALNAAIEAARAGEQGRGFAVVASQVRNLAEQSAASATQISDLVTSIRTETDGVVSSMEESQHEVAVGLEHVVETRVSFEKILHSVQQAAEQARDVAGSVQQILQSSHQVSKSVGLIAEVAKTASSGTEQAADEAQEQRKLMEDVASSAQTLSLLAKELLDTTSQFEI